MVHISPVIKNDMNLNVDPYILYFITFTASLLISLYAVRKILFITTRRKIYDIPDKIRKIHGDGIPSLGGIGIFAGYLVAAAFFMYMKNWNYIIASSVILFFTGIYDDLVNMRPSKKLLAQLIASGITVYFADIRIASLHGVFGIYELPYLLSVVVTVLGCSLFINVFNFVDGIDGLAGATAILYTVILSCLFAAMKDSGLACISLSLAGATAGLLFFNFAPAKIYMGDTGSMVLGFTIFLLSVLFVNAYDGGAGTHISSFVHSGQGAFMLSFAVLFYPLYDGMRVFILRLSRGISPFNADRTHLHYYLLDAGFTHSGAVAVILGTNIVTIALVWLLQDAATMSIVCVLALWTIVLAVIYMLRQKNKRNSKA